MTVDSHTHTHTHTHHASGFRPEVHRGAVAGLDTPHPIGATLPAMLQEDDFVQRLCAGLDPLLAPIFATLDAFPAYLDPATAPRDVLTWLSGWLGLTLAAGQGEALARRLVHEGAELLRWRGTLRGIRDGVECVFGITPQVIESGSAAWSQTPGAVLPGTATAFLVVRLPTADPDAIDLRRLDDVVHTFKPAHIPHRVEIFTP